LAKVKNPSEYKSFRRGVLAAYIALAGYASVCAAISTAQGAYGRMGRAPPSSPRAEVDAQALGWCLQEVEGLSAELNRRLDATLAGWPARHSSVEWEDWSPAWRQRLLVVGARCRLEEGDVPQAADLQQAWLRLGQLHRQYTTLAVQFSKEIGPWADSLHQAIEKARASLPPQQ
jgi:hypothetical protein